ncbi:MAG: sulfatase family protein [Promethearchaeota archaeon]
MDNGNFAKEKLSKPNVIYIITHDQGIAAACFNGAGPDANPNLPTPNIDKFAESGVKLMKHFGTAPFCSPARGSLLTGMYPHSNGLIGLAHRNFSYKQGVKTLIQHFKEHNYHTILIGLQHEDKDASRLGYDELIATQFIPRCEYLLEDIEEKLKELSEIEDKKGDHANPFWLTIGTEEIHRDWSIRADPVDPSEVIVPPYLPDTPEVRKDIAGFIGVLKKYDEFFGKILDLINKFGLIEKSIIIFTTDHGIAIPRAKGTLYDPGVHTGMIISWKDHIKEGVKLDQLISSVDFAPTICDLCMVPYHEQFQGQSYADLILNEKSKHIIFDNAERLKIEKEQNMGHNNNLKNNATNEDKTFREYIFSENNFGDIYNPIRSVRTKDYKYIRNYSKGRIKLSQIVPKDIRASPIYEAWKKNIKDHILYEEEFYDLNEDPLEFNNLALTKPDHPELIKLRNALDKWLIETGDPIRFGYILPDKKARIDNFDDFKDILNKDLKE